jgi:hypothetical protein
MYEDGTISIVKLVLIPSNKRHEYGNLNGVIVLRLTQQYQLVKQIITLKRETFGEILINVLNFLNQN